MPKRCSGHRDEHVAADPQTWFGLAPVLEAGLGMKTPWLGNKCIICLGNEARSEEHVIPEALGGDLTCDFLCKPCNDVFGSSFEAKAKTDPAIRIAVAKLRSEIPRLYDQIEEGQHYRAQNGPAIGIYRGGTVMPRTFRHKDGSLIAPSSDAQEHIERMLVTDGQTSDFVQAALEKSAAAPEMETIELSPGVSIINWPSDNAKPDFSRGIPVDDLVVVKIGFEFFALLSGTAIYNDKPRLNAVRHALRSGQPSAAFTVERLEANDYASFHGVCFEGNDPYAKIQVRLFGKLAYRVHFHHLSLDQTKIVYTHDLKSGEHDVRKY
jgi:HNH endonuclease